MVSETRIKELVEELLTELESADGIDPETVATARQLKDSIKDLVDPETDSEENTIMDDAIALEATFAASHPVAERIIRELINSLSKIGI